MKKSLKVALGVLAFGTLALAAMPTGRAMAQSTDLKVACNPQVRIECVDEVAADTKCCIDPNANGCRIIKLNVEPDEKLPAQESPEACVLQGIGELGGCAKCQFPEGLQEQR